LTSTQKETLIKAGISLYDYDAINIEFIDFKVPENLKNVIFTSQNAVRAFLEKCLIEEHRDIKCFCVGEKTKLLLEKNDLKVIKTAKNASFLVNYISKYHKNDTFFFFCGNLRREEIPTELKKAKITVFEVKTYKTTLNQVFFDQKWDGILFFSPSGVQSFVQGNHCLTNGKMISAICIGDTTTSEAKKYTKNVFVSKNTTVESVIEKAIEIFEGKFTK
jgi:uroporphyrinogen-III synthase